MRKIALLVAAVAVVCVAANQASAGGVRSYQKAIYGAGMHHGGPNVVVHQVARVPRGHHGYQYAPRYYGHGYGYMRPPVVVHPPVYHPPVYVRPRVVVPYAQPYYVPRRGISYHGSGISIGIGF
ncbi:MAG: hypothetical protein HQ567_07310 [Candidatus Nealsonbacteria bacterium]|nr:hypothetical protein [Candidatus Nealsonbacteria bacterium]